MKAFAPTYAFTKALIEIVKLRNQTLDAIQATYTGDRCDGLVSAECERYNRYMADFDAGWKKFRKAQRIAKRRKQLSHEPPAKAGGLSVFSPVFDAGSTKRT